MPADPPASLLITPDRRRRLQQRYDEARQLGNQPRPDFRHIHDLLADCLRADPANILYLDALLANLKRRDATGKGPRRLWTWLTGWMWVGRAPPMKKHDKREGLALPPSTEHSVLSTQHRLLQDAADLLWGEPNTLSHLHQLAAAASDCDFDEAELRYLAAARDVAPDDAETLRLVARALTRQGRFEDALGPWFAVLALAPSDSEAEQAALDLRGVAVAPEPITPRENGEPSASGDAQALLQQARASQDAGRFESAEHYFAQAQAALGGDLALLEERERSRLLRSEQRVQIARRRAEHDQHPKAQSLVARLETEHNRLEIDMLNLRAERLPTEWGVRLELARRLKQAGNFSGAVQRLEEAQRLAPSEATVLLELGESWQHLRQFAKALDYYQQAIATAAVGVPAAEDALLLSRYRTAVLASAMGQIELAKSQFAAIVAVQPEYKDTPQRLTSLSLAGASG